MPLSPQQTVEIEQLLKMQVRRKLCDYSPETKSMPFHTRLLGQDRMALFSFVHSINTTLGTSVFEQIATIVAKPNFRKAINQYKGLNSLISADAQRVVQQIIDDLQSINNQPNKSDEIEKIFEVAQSGDFVRVKRPTIDLYLEGDDGIEYYFDIKTAKPNLDDILGFKRKLLEWVAIRGATNKDVKIFTGLAIPYNPYEPEPYNRWTFRGMFDLDNELMVADELWTFLGGEKAYEQLLLVFEKVGVELRPEIDSRFAQFGSHG